MYMNKVKRISFGVILTLALLFSISLTALAEDKSQYINFAYKPYTVYGELNVSWYPILKDNASAKTYVNGSSGSFYLGAYCNAYGKDGLLGGTNKVAHDSAKTSTISYFATEFRSVHNIQDSQYVPLKSTKLSLSK